MSSLLTFLHRYRDEDEQMKDDTASFQPGEEEEAGDQCGRGGCEGEEAVCRRGYLETQEVVSLCFYNLPPGGASRLCRSGGSAGPH
jgi:hypothetical protein